MRCIKRELQVYKLLLDSAQQVYIALRITRVPLNNLQRGTKSSHIVKNLYALS